MKRAFDALTAVLTLMLLSFIILIVALLVRFKLGSPIIFKQQRPGLHGKPFYVYKFRTMTDAKDEEGNFLPDNVRLTSFGKLLRKLSLDELPQLINVIKGDISLVGPRPLLIDEKVTGVTYLDVIEALAAQNIEARPVWKPLHR
ncbi:sugar transferase [Bacillus sp. FSL K6-0042]|uniref:sugar transferase n=1 Tax=Bacillus sp. FSL K6-0042 TaxID=2921407 RepID=UPI002FFEBCF2